MRRSCPTRSYPTVSTGLPGRSPARGETGRALWIARAAPSQNRTNDWVEALGLDRREASVPRARVAGGRGDLRVGGRGGDELRARDAVLGAASRGGLRRGHGARRRCAGAGSGGAG